MIENAKAASVYRFGVFEANPQTGELQRKGARLKLQEQPFQLLILLLENAGELVGRETICQRLWPGNTFVDFDACLSVAVGKLREALGDAAANPRFIETVPRRGYKFVAPVTKHAAVPARAEGVAKSPASIAIPAAPQHGLNRNPMIAGIAAAVVVGLGLYSLRSLLRPTFHSAEAHSALSPVNIRRSVAVLGFRNLPGRAEDKWLSAAFSEMLNTELGADGEVRMVSGEDVARAKSDLLLADEDTLAPSTLQRLRTDPGADVVVLGSYTLLPGGGQIRLDLRIQDTAAGETIAEEALSGDENDLFQLADRAGQDLRQKLGLHRISSENSTAIRAAMPSNERAARLFAAGREKLWAFDLASARSLLTEAITADPKYPLSHSALADALWHSGYEVKARKEAQLAVDLSDHLSQEQRLLVEGTYRKAIADYPKAVEAYQKLFHIFPDNLDYGLLLASAQNYLKHSDALQTLATLRRLPPPMRDDARIDVAEASTWINTDFNRAQEAARRAIAKASAQGSHVLVSRTLGILCQQGPSAGNLEQALSDCENALDSSIETHDVNGESLMRTDLAAIYYQRGDLKEAEKISRQALAGFRQVGNLSGAATALSNIAAVRVSLGDLPDAKRLLEESIPDYQATEDKEGVALNLNNLGDLSRQNGNLKTADVFYAQAKATAKEIDDKNAIAYVLNGEGDVLLDRGDLAAARKSYEESLALRKQAGEKQMAAETETALALVSIEEGHAADAEAVVRKLQPEFHREGSSDDELAAGVVLVKALLTESKQIDAQHEYEQAQNLAKKSQNPYVRLQYALAGARVKLNSDHPAESRPLLIQIDEEARRRDFNGIELEDRLLQAELAKKLGRYALAQEQLTAVENSASAKGFGLISRRATSDRQASRSAPNL
jgi:DNA-binding winged helix-turn-helix (wHTH) protein/tetratricopeptide (TPR) repeat protein